MSTILSGTLKVQHLTTANENLEIIVSFEMKSEE